MTVDSTDDIDSSVPVESRDVTEVFHEMLLRLAGKLPDDLTAAARGWLGQSDLAAVASAITSAVVTYRIPILDSDLVALAAAFGDISAGEQPATTGIELQAWLDRVELGTTVEAAPSKFVPTLADSSEGLDAVDRAALEAVTAEAGARGLWRAWRQAPLGSPWPPPRRVFVVEIAAALAGLPAVTARIQQRMVAAGEEAPQVEVYPVGTGLPLPYQRQVQTFGVLLWAAENMPEPRLASVCDDVDETGAARFRADHSTVDDDVERQRMLSYLLAGTILLSSDRLEQDIAEPSRGEVVPVRIRTDGTWIWSDASAYYLAEHRLAPDPELVAYLLGTAPEMPPPIDDVTYHRILGWLNEPDEPVV